MKKEWNDRQVEALLRKAVGRSVPDIYRQVAAQEVPPLINEDHIVPPPVRRRRRRWPYVLALLALAAAGIVLYLLLSTAAIIAVGENRDVELSVNRFQRVLDVRSHTSVGDAVLEGQSLEHQQVDDALEAVFTAMAASAPVTRQTSSSKLRHLSPRCPFSRSYSRLEYPPAIFIAA